MKVKAITLDENELPATVTVEMTASEALYLAVVTGRQNGPSADEFLPGGSESNSAVYDCLVGGLFNRFFDDGVNEAKRVYG